MSDARGVAFVTGASRGIGKAIAVQPRPAPATTSRAPPARCTRARRASTRRRCKRSDTSPAARARSTSTAALVEAEGRQALLGVPATCSTATTLGSSVATVLERWGRVDVLVNNGRYIGPGHMDRLLDTPVELLDKHLEAQRDGAAHPHQAGAAADDRARRAASIMNITSGVAYERPARRRRRGRLGTRLRDLEGRAAPHRGHRGSSTSSDGILAYNVHPGFVATERIDQDMGAFGFDADAGRAGRRHRCGRRVALHRARGTSEERGVDRGPGADRRAGAAAGMGRTVTGERAGRRRSRLNYLPQRRIAPCTPGRDVLISNVCSSPTPPTRSTWFARVWTGWLPRTVRRGRRRRAPTD